MKPEGLLAFQEVLDKPHLIYDNRSDGDPEIPEDLNDALKRNSKAFENFMNFTPSTRRIYIDWLNSAKRPDTREKRIKRIVELSENNKRPGMM